MVEARSFSSVARSGDSVIADVSSANCTIFVLIAEVVAEGARSFTRIEKSSGPRFDP